MNDSDVIDRLARIDVKLDQLLARGDDHEARLRVVEQRAEPQREHAVLLQQQANEITELKGELAEQKKELGDVQRVRWQVTGLIAGLAAGGGGVVGSLVTNMLSGG